MSTLRTLILASLLLFVPGCTFAARLDLTLTPNPPAGCKQPAGQE